MSKERLKRIKIKGAAFDAVAEGYKTQIRIPSLRFLDEDVTPYCKGEKVCLVSPPPARRRKTRYMTVRICAVRKEMLQDISTEDILHEGIFIYGTLFPQDEFAEYWDGKLPKKERRTFGYNCNPEVLVIEFERVS